MDEIFLDHYVWHDDKNQQSVEKHGLSFQRAAIALEQGNPIECERKKDDGRQEWLTCLNNEGMIVVTQQAGEQTKIISAHWDTRNSRDLALEEYERLAAQQGIEKNTEFNQQYADWKQLDTDQKKANKFDFDKITERHTEEQKVLAAREDLTPAQRAKDFAHLKEQQKQEAVIDRQPRLERDSKEREALAKEHQNEQNRVLTEAAQWKELAQEQALREAYFKRQIESEFKDLEKEILAAIQPPTPEAALSAKGKVSETVAKTLNPKLKTRDEQQREKEEKHRQNIDAKKAELTKQKEEKIAAFMQRETARREQEGKRLEERLSREQEVAARQARAAKNVPKEAEPEPEATIQKTLDKDIGRER